MRSGGRRSAISAARWAHPARLQAWAHAARQTPLNRIYQESLNLLATALKATNEAAHKAEAAREKGDVDQEIADEVFELGDIVKSATTMCPAARRLFNDIAGILLRDEHEEEAASIGQVPADEFNAVVVQGHGGGISTS